MCKLRVRVCSVREGKLGEKDARYIVVCGMQIAEYVSSDGVETDAETYSQLPENSVHSHAAKEEVLQECLRSTG